MLTVILVRHGKTPGNALARYIGTTDELLLEEEKERLQSIAAQFPKADRLYCSPLLRCWQTANILYSGQEQFLVPELRECNFGDFENKNYKELDGNEDYQRWIDSNGMLPFPNGESREAFQERCCRGFLSCIRECIADGIHSPAFVVHGGTIMSILERFAVPRKSYYEWHVGNGEGYVLEIDPKDPFVCRVLRKIG
ncbi:MAG: histidine phosphatase family protein [Eubacteriales bacterium]|nr:histidine phosphatase family protein [Eubacteriales bacterium]